MRAEDRATVLERMALEGFEGRAYVLGCRENRVTVRDQQVRALNLAYAMEDLQGLDVAVVGGGAAGMSFAAAALIRGAKVTLYERDGALARLLSSANARPLEPFLFEWPRAGWQEREAGLPLMNWRSGSAAQVVSDLRDRFLALAGLFDLAPIFGASVARIALVEGGVKVFLPEATPTHERVVLAVGFGLERGLQERGADALSYWAPSPNEAPAYLQSGDRTRVREVLISGCGDGGLADFLMVRLRDHGAPLMRALFGEADAALRALFDAVLAIDEVVEREGKSDERYLLDAYLQLEIDHEAAIQAVDAKLRAQLDETTRATLCHDLESPLRFQAFRLNRFMTFRVLRLDGMEVDEDGVCRGGFIQGRSELVEGVTDLTVVGGQQFEACIPRHGPEPELASLLPTHTPCGRRPPEEVDPTRAPLWARADLQADVLRSSLADALVDSASEGFLGQAERLMAWCAEHAGAVRAGVRPLSDVERVAWNDAVESWASLLTREGLSAEALQGLLRTLVIERRWSAAQVARGVLRAFERCVGEPPATRLPWHIQALQRSLGAVRALRAGEALPAFASADRWTPEGTRHLTRAPGAALLDQYPVQLRWVSTLRAISGVIARPEGVSEEELASFCRSSACGALVLSEWADGEATSPSLSKSRGVCALGAVVEGDQVWTPLRVGGRTFRHQKFTRCGHAEEPAAPPQQPALQLFMSTETSALVLTCTDLWQEAGVRSLIAALRPAWVLVPACEHTPLDELKVLARSLAREQGVRLVGAHPGGSVVVTEWLDETERI